jgi:DNA primase
VADAELGHERYKGSISIPYLDAQGRQVGMRFRHLIPERVKRHKYQALEGSKTHLYGVKFVDEAQIDLVEGEFDTLIMRQAGKVAVGIPGVNSFRPEWRWLFRNCDLVRVLFDGDAATNEHVRKARDKVLGALRRVTNVMRVDMPAGMDPTDLFLAGRLKEVL